MILTPILFRDIESIFSWNEIFDLNEADEYFQIWSQWKELFLLILFQIGNSLTWSAYEINVDLLYSRNLCLIYTDFNKSSRIFICSIYHERKHFKFDLKIPVLKENVLNFINHMLQIWILNIQNFYWMCRFLKFANVSKCTGKQCVRI